MTDSNPLQYSNRQWLWPALALLGLSLAGLAAFLCLRFASGFAFDPALLLAFRTPGDLATPIGPPWLLQSAIDISALAGYTVLWLAGAATLIFLFAFGRRAEALLLGGSLIGASMINALLKLFLHRPRPDVVPHLAEVSSASFPSGHAMISAAVYLTLGIMVAQTQASRWARAYILSFAVLLVLLIGCSRVFLGVHWPSDVLAGWCFGAIWALCMFALNARLHRRQDFGR
ncbi:PAP2 family protein [Sphingomonas sp. ABOLD]|uniref:Undecaprenyl-diphosphatase n=1 Tax=Sphingomonas trueperi TaxID=53317 RepID=A0A7X5XW23_9SPHN|nr:MULTISPECIES: phosphatase PAP2 family protein [Sphingomonas]NJB96132.1 undecaprenyl-diphosphatase [Sphingomonas trueperi]RSV44900.1 PAP2 family protein [Sphingomonas sp. ABOLE]RSV51095.1 PAP2 family protein [Sphingomonas sp. ABOLD]